MTIGSEPDNRRQVLKQALLAIDELRARLAAVEAARRVPIAVVGIGCRYPGGVSGPADYWRLLCDGVDAVTEVPPSRWDISVWYDPDRSIPGKSATRWGGFLESIDQFDPHFFGIAPREATMLDPQHRLLLETAWESLENAGLAPDRLAGSRTGVFVGVTGCEYFQLLARNLLPAELDAYIVTGNALNATAGRVSYLLGLHGPSLAVDTACSSSLVAVHLACQSLRQGECRLALAAGVNVVLVPESFVIFSKWGMMAADGRCKAFDADADGFVRAEGCGVVVLKRLSDALTDGDQVLAVIKGTAVSQDGRSSGLTAPNGLAQQAVLRLALEDAGLLPSEVDYVEAHGTGTALGDPIEVEALAAVLGEGRESGRRLLIGSVKTNLGHTESASGIAGLIKAVLAVHQGEIPPQLHLNRLTSQIAWDTIPVDVVTARTPWPPGDGPRRAGVSSFGLSGTNAHVIVEQAPAVQPAGAAVDRPLHLFTLSAKTDVALRELAARHARYLAEQPGEPLCSICFTANVGRAQFAHRLALPAATAGRLREELAAVARGEIPAAAAFGSFGGGHRPKVAFLFTGQGSQYAGMGRQLYETQPTFRHALDRCAELLTPHLDEPLISVLFPPDGRSAVLNQTAWAQPALFALEYALAELWACWGVEPAAVIGHSVGEYVAACRAGVFSLEDGLRLIAARGRLMQALPSGGAMAAVFADEHQVRRVLAAHDGDLAVGALNAPDQVVISGRSVAVEAVVAALAAQGLRAERLAVSHAFHSSLMEPMLAPFARAASDVAYSPPRTPLVSNITGTFVRGSEIARADYWVRQAREQVRFADGIRELHKQGYDLFVEIGPSPTLAGLGQRCLGSGVGTWLASLRRGRSDWEQIIESLGKLYIRGVEIDLAGFDRDYQRRRVALPTYPFQRQRCWFDVAGGQPAAGQSTRAASPMPMPTTGHPLLGGCARSPLVDQIIFNGRLGVATLPWLQDHVVLGQVIVPLTAYVEMALAAAREAFDARPHAIEDLVVQEALILAPDESRDVQLVLTPGAGETAPFQIISLRGASENLTSSWTVHATGRVRLDHAESDARPAGSELDLGAMRAACPIEVEAEEFYRRFGDRGIAFGASFRGVRAVWTGERQAVGEVTLPEWLTAEAERYTFHPAFLDACLQPLAAVWPADGAASPTHVPLSVERFRWYGRPRGRVISHAGLRAGTGASGEALMGDIHIFGTSGELLAEVTGLLTRRTDREALTRATQQSVDGLLYEVTWREQPDDGRAAGGLEDERRWLDGLADGIRTRLAAAAAEPGVREYERAFPEIERLSTAYATAALRQLGWAPRPGDRFTLKGLVEQLGVAGRFHRLLGCVAAMLHEDGLLAQTPTGWEVRGTPEVVDPASRHRQLLAAFPACATVLRLVGRCGECLAEVLQGARDPLPILFSPEGLADLEQLYRDSPVTATFNHLVRDAFAEVVRRLPEGRKLRVLEIGGGTGGTTAHVLPLLPAGRTEYVFTDVSPLFTARAAREFGADSLLACQVLDVERDPTEQGFDGHKYDIILAANVLHATANLRRSLGHVRQLLAPGGVLILHEVIRPQRWIDLTFGLTDGWWKFTDLALRPHHPLLGAAAWLDLLGDMGFQEARAISQAGSVGPLAAQAVILARGPAGAVAAEREFPRTWLVFGDRRGTGGRMAAELESRGQTCVVVEPGRDWARLDRTRFTVNPASRDDYVRLLREVAGTAGPRCAGVLHLWSLDSPASEGLTADQLWQDQENGCRSALHLAQALGAASQSDPPRLWLFTQGAQAVGDGISALTVATTTIWGLGKVIALEHPELRPTCVDLEIGASGAELAGVVAALLEDGIDDQLAFRNGLRHVARLVRRGPAAAEEAVRLVSATPGVLAGLALRPLERRQPGPGEVEIRVEAAGLNFRDVLCALDLYPGEVGELGGEIAGVVSAIGSGVKGFDVGDAVAGLAAGGLGSYVTERTELLIAKPAALSFAEAATIPAAFLTAYYTLHSLGKMIGGERVLIHAASGGVGLAAVQLAQRAGCEVFATAGSPEKRAFLRSLGVPHVFDSRTTAFAEMVLEVTGGKGVDLVLNCLSGAFIAASVEVLQPRGRFLEIGMRDIWDADRVRTVRPQASYHAVDLGTLCRTEPALIQSVLAEVQAILRQGGIRPLPYRVFPRNRVADAFRYMAQARHIGKLVVAWTAADRQPPPRGRVIWEADATHLITGGLAGLGLRLAGWLVERGVRHLALMARSEPSPEARTVLADLEARGARVLVCRGDVSQAGDVERVLGDIAAALPPLRGVIHAAGVLDDGVILQQDWGRFVAVLGPKVAGAWHLHRLTRDLSLDSFVLFSSIAALLGQPGLSNHAAANAFLDALAHHRRSLGLPALSVNWGAWSEIGAFARRGDDVSLKARGVGIFSPREGVAALEHLLATGAVQAGVMPMDWPRFASHLPAGGPRRFLAEVTTAPGLPLAGPVHEARPGLLARLSQARVAERRKLLEAHVREEVGKVLGLDPAFSLDPHRGLRDVGIDSLMSIELRNRLQAGLERPLPGTLVFDYPTVASLVDFLAKEVLGRDVPDNGEAEARAPAGGPDADLLAALDGMSAAEAEALLLQELTRDGGRRA